jgi:hypothetical protein
MLIKPITVRLLAYGQKANIAKVRKAACDLLDDEHDAIDPSWFVDRPGVEVFNEIVATRWDAEIALKKPSPSQLGIQIVMPDVHERITTEWLYELPIAKTCVLFASWHSTKDDGNWQLLAAEGDRWSERRGA